MMIRADDGSAVIDTAGTAIFIQPTDESATTFGLWALGPAGAPILLSRGSVERVRAALEAVWTAASKQRRFVNLAEAIGPPSELTIAKAIPDLGAPAVAT